MKVYDELMSEGKDPLRGARKAARRTTPELEAFKEKLRKELADKKKKKKVDEGLLKRYFAKRRAKKEARAQEKAASRKEREDKEFEASVAKEPKRTRDRLDKQKRMQKAAAEQDKDPSVAGTDNPSKLKDPGEPAPPKRNGFAASGNGNGMRLSRDVSHTEHEGPSLAEQLKFIKEITGGIFLKPGMEKAKKAMAKGLKKGSPRALAIKAKLTPGTKEHEDRQAKIKFAAKVRSFNRDRATGSDDETSSEETRAQRKARKTAEQNAREAANKARREGGSENASTKYEGPSLAEQLKFIKETSQATKALQRRLNPEFHGPKGGEDEPPDEVEPSPEKSARAARRRAGGDFRKATPGAGETQVRGQKKVKGAKAPEVKGWREIQNKADAKRRDPWPTDDEMAQARARGEAERRARRSDIARKREVRKKALKSKGATNEGLSLAEQAKIVRSIIEMGPEAKAYRKARKEGKWGEVSDLYGKIPVSKKRQKARRAQFAYPNEPTKGRLLKKSFRYGDSGFGKVTEISKDYIKAAAKADKARSERKIKWETHSQVGGRQRDEEDVAHSIGMHHGRKELINKKMRKLLARKASREARDK
jgi:hypothetical protein